MDRTTIFGLLLGGVSLLVGYILEGGSAGMIFQATAAVIVLGGTAGAVCLSFSGAQLSQSWRSLAQIFRHPRDQKTPGQVIRLVELAYRARREGLLALESEVAQLPDPFLRRGLQLVIDGFSPQQVREIMAMDLSQQDESGRMPARVFEAAGGSRSCSTSPTRPAWAPGWPWPSWPPFTGWLPPTWSFSPLPIS